MTTYRTPSGQEYPEYTPFARYKAPCGITWICLKPGDKQLRWFDLSMLREVVSPFDSGLLYGCELPPRALLVLTVPPWLAAGINPALSVGSVIKVVQPTLWHAEFRRVA